MPIAMLDTMHSSWTMDNKLHDSIYYITVMINENMCKMFGIMVAYLINVIFFS